MRNIVRNNYTPKIGDYHDVTVHDQELGKVWQFDCDGIYLDLSKTNVIVVNKGGDSEEYAISQKFVTDNINKLTRDINNVDEAAQGRETEIMNALAESNAELQANIDKVEEDAIERENNINKTLTDKVALLDNDIENLNTVANKLTDNVNTINKTAVFDVSFNQENERISFTVTDGTETTTSEIREASETKNGLMPAASFSQVKANTQAIRQLQNAGLYRGSFATLADAPTTTPNEAFVGGEATQNDFVSIQDATHEGQHGIARYRIAVDGNAVSYNFELFIDKDIQNFSEGEAGLIVGSDSSTDGTIAAQADGTGYVNGWDMMKFHLQATEEGLTEVRGKVNKLDTDFAAEQEKVSGIDTRLTAAEGELPGIKSGLTSIGALAGQAMGGVSTLNNKPVEVKAEAGQTTATKYLSQLGSERLLSDKGLMNHFVDITETGLPDNPDANTFYYTTL